MIVDIVMPKMGESITEGTILEWRKKVGDPVEKDELFLEIGTDKVDSEIPCVESGIIVEILAEVNEVVEVGKVIAKIETDQLSTGQLKPIQPFAESDLCQSTMSSLVNGSPFSIFSLTCFGYSFAKKSLTSSLNSKSFEEKLNSIIYFL